MGHTFSYQVMGKEIMKDCCMGCFHFSVSSNGSDNVMSNCDSYLNSCSENFLVRWDSTGMPKEIEKLNNLPALFTVTESQSADCVPWVFKV